MKSFECKNCGAQVVYEPTRTTLRCAFCDSEYVVESEVSPSALLGEEAAGAERWIIPFALDRDAAGERYKEWIGKGFWAPKDLSVSAKLDKMEGLYIPSWLFEYEAESAWHGKYSQTEYRTVTKTRTDPETGETETYTEREPYQVWFPKSGTHFGRYLLPVPASKGITQEEAERLSEVSLDQLKPFDESYLAGWQAEVAEVSEVAAKERAEERIRELERRACSREVERLEGCSTRLEHKSTRFLFLPVFVMAYTYKDKLYRVLIDGRDGKIQGEKPTSKVKVAIAVGIGALLIALIVLLISMSGSTPG
jgi:hypothetical protein